MDGVEAHLQALLAEHTAVLGTGFTLVHREYPTAIGPVDLTCREADGSSVVVEVKRRGEIDGVEQLARYLELLNRDGLRGFTGGATTARDHAPCRRPVLQRARGAAPSTTRFKIDHPVLHPPSSV